jgi:alpha-D-xyloside xylohydrolase
MVVQQYTAVVGKPMMQPYWSLGFHNCKYGYTGLEQVQGVVQGYQAANIPLDIQWMDIDYMQDYRDWTWSSGNFDQAQVAKFVDGLHAQGMHFVPIVDPGIMVYPDYPAYQQGLKEGLFVQDLTNETPYLGQVWPGPVNFPDFLNPGTQAYWTQSIRDFWGGVQVDGLWIDMNEVSNFCNDDGTGQVCVNNDPDNCPTGDINTQTTCCLTCSEVDSTNQLEYPPYRIHNQKGNGNLGVKTMSPSALHYGNVTEYNVHNLYVFCYTVSLPSFLVCGVSVSLLPIFCCLLAFSDTTWHGSNHHPPLNQSTQCHITCYLIGTASRSRLPPTRH